MNDHIPNIDAQFRRYADLLLQHHGFLVSGKDDDPQTERVEEQMTQLWDTLDDLQRRSLAGLGSDLNWVRRRGQLAERSRPAQVVSEKDLQALYQSRGDADWHALLHQLRLCAARIPTIELAHLRAASWNALSLHQIAAVFSALVADLEPSRV